MDEKRLSPARWDSTRRSTTVVGPHGVDVPLMEATLDGNLQRVEDDSVTKV